MNGADAGPLALTPDVGSYLAETCKLLPQAHISL
jgi:hypothetical protein